MWGHTSSIIAAIANANRDPKEHPQPFVPAQFNPYLDNKAKPPNVIRLDDEAAIAIFRSKFTQ